MMAGVSGPRPDDPATLADRVLAAAPRCGQVRVVCIDGPAGSGKTTLADTLALELRSRLDAPVPVVHLDDLYEGWSQELGAPLSARLDAWLLTPWRSGLAGRHPRYDWALGHYTAWAEVAAATAVVVEGCGAASRGIRWAACLTIWVEAAADVRLARGLARDGAGLAEHWRRWQRAEAEHFAADGTRAAADVIITT
jgi:uridine kinase